jgi:hypothetical protein
MHTGAYAHRFDSLSQSTGMRRYGLGTGLMGPNDPVSTQDYTPPAGCPPCTCKKPDYGLLILGLCVAVPLLGFAILS